MESLKYMENFQAHTKNSYVNGKCKSMEEKSYFRMGHIIIFLNSSKLSFKSYTVSFY